MRPPALSGLQALVVSSCHRNLCGARRGLAPWGHIAALVHFRPVLKDGDAEGPSGTPGHPRRGESVVVRCVSALRSRWERCEDFSGAARGNQTRQWQILASGSCLRTGIGFPRALARPSPLRGPPARREPRAAQVARRPPRVRHATLGVQRGVGRHRRPLLMSRPCRMERSALVGNWLNLAVFPANRSARVAQSVSRANHLIYNNYIG